MTPARRCYKRAPAYGLDLLETRRSGARVGLVVIGVHDWDAGQEVAARSGTARLVVPVDSLPHDLDWRCVTALDCLFLGECDEAVFYAAVTMAHAAGAASLWALYAGEIWRLERWRSPLCPMGFYAADGPFPPARLAQTVANYRRYALLAAHDAYADRLFDGARQAQFCAVFGDAAGPIIFDKFQQRRAA